MYTHIDTYLHVQPSHTHTHTHTRTLSRQLTETPALRSVSAFITSPFPYTRINNVVHIRVHFMYGLCVHTWTGAGAGAGASPVCTGARNDSSKALSSSAVPLGSPSSSTSLHAHCKFNARALPPAHPSTRTHPPPHMTCMHPPPHMTCILPHALILLLI
jgi:hypothetical protein